MIDQYLGIQKVLLRDFYPLTPYSQAGDAWLAYPAAPARPQTKESSIALKRPASSATRATFRLQGLDADALYEVANLNTGKSDKLAASRLTNAGLESNFPPARIRHSCVTAGSRCSEMLPSCGEREQFVFHDPVSVGRQLPARNELSKPPRSW